MRAVMAAITVTAHTSAMSDRQIERQASPADRRRCGTNSTMNRLMSSTTSRACDSSNSASGAPLYSMCAPATISCSAFGIENGLLLSRAGMASRNAIAAKTPRPARRALLQIAQAESAGVLRHRDHGAEERQVVAEHQDRLAHRAHLAVDRLRDVAGEHVAEHGDLEQEQQQHDVARKRTERSSRARERSPDRAPSRPRRRPAGHRRACGSLPRARRSACPAASRDRTGADRRADLCGPAGARSACARSTGRGSPARRRRAFPAR